MPHAKCVVILSEKSSGSSACQNLLAKCAGAKHVAKTRHFENETLYWTKAASILGRPQTKMVDSEVPIAPDIARADLLQLLRENAPDFVPPSGNKALIMEGWGALCRTYGPIFLEKSPHHLCQWSALELIMESMSYLDEIEFLLIGLVRNPMDTLYSHYKRWKSTPEKVQWQWLRAYRNLLSLKEILGDGVVIVRYEDMVSSLSQMKPVLEFCSAADCDQDSAYLHSRSLSKWKTDRLFGFSLAPEVLDLAERYGYDRAELQNSPNRFWPLVRTVSRAAYQGAKPLYVFVRKFDRA